MDERYEEICVLVRSLKGLLSPGLPVRFWRAHHENCLQNNRFL